MSLVNPNIKKSKTIPSKFYYSKKKFEELKELIFHKHWQFICDKSQLKKNGDAFPYSFIEDFIEEPLLLINDNNNIRSMTNVCTHRGNILCTRKSNNNSIQCKYHGRTFDLNGIMKNMPGFKEFSLINPIIIKNILKQYSPHVIKIKRPNTFLMEWENVS